MGIKYSDIFPLNIVGNGGSSALGLIWETQIADFTAQVGKGYFCEPTTKILATLPSNPSTNSKIGFALTSGTTLNIKGTDKFNGNLLAANFGKKLLTKQLIVIFTYTGSTTGWTWDSDNITDAYLDNQIILPFTSNTALDGLFDCIGKNYGSSAWANPYPSKISVSTTTTSGTAIGTNIANLFDKDLASFANIGSTSNTTSYTTISLPTNTKIQPTNIFVRYGNKVGGGQQFILKGIKEDDSKVTLLTQTSTYQSVNDCSGTFNTTDLYKAFEITRAEYDYNYYAFEVWGNYAL